MNVMAFTGRLAHLEIESPIFNAGGLVRDAHAMEKICKTGAGLAELGSYTKYARFFDDQQSRNDYHFNSETQIASNAVRMPNPGKEGLRKIFPQILDIAREAGKPLILNMALVSDNPADEAAEMASFGYEIGADAVLINPACPSLDKQNSLSYSFDELRLVLEALRPIAAKHQPVFWRPDPATKYEDVRQMIRTMDDVGRNQQVVGALFMTNTWRLTDEERKAIGFGPGLGGKSGPGMKKPARHQLAWARSAMLGSLKHNYDVVSSIGVDSGKEVYFRTELLGAAACAITSSLYPVKNWNEVVDKMIREYADVKTAEETF